MDGNELTNNINDVVKIIKGVVKLKKTLDSLPASSMKRVSKYIQQLLKCTASEAESILSEIIVSDETYFDASVKSITKYDSAITSEKVEEYVVLIFKEMCASKDFREILEIENLIITNDSKNLLVEIDKKVSAGLIKPNEIFEFEYFESKLKLNSDRSLKKPIDIAFFNYENNEFESQFLESIKNRDVINVVGPSIEETLYYILFILKKNNIDKVGVINEVEKWNSTEHGNYNYLIANFAGAKNVDVINGVTNIHIYSEKNFNACDCLDFSNPINTRIRLQKYTGLSNMKIVEVIENAHNCYLSYKMKLFVNNSNEYDIQFQFSPQEVVKFLYFPFTQNAIYNDSNSISVSCNEDILSFIQKHDNCKFSSFENIYFVPNKVEIVHANKKILDGSFLNFVDKEIDDFLEHVFYVLTNPPEWYKNNTIKTISKGQNQFSDYHINGLIKSIKILQSVEIFNGKLHSFYNRLFESNLSDASFSWMIKYVGEIFFYNTGWLNSNYKHYNIGKFFTRALGIEFKDLLPIGGKNNYYGVYLSRYVSENINNITNYNLSFKIIFDIMSDEYFESDRNSYFFQVNFSDGWKNTCFNEKEILKFTRRVAKSKNHQKLLVLISDYYYKGRQTMGYSLEYDETYLLRGKELCFSEQFNVAMNEILLEKHVNFQILLNIFSSKVVCLSSNFESICNALLNSNINTLEIAKLEIKIAEKLWDNKKFNRGKTADQINNLLKFLEILKSKDGYDTKVFYLIQNPRNSLFWNDEEYISATFDEMYDEYMNTLLPLFGKSIYKAYFSTIKKVGLENIQNVEPLKYYLKNHVTKDGIIEFLSNNINNISYIMMMRILTLKYEIEIPFINIYNFIESLNYSETEKMNIYANAKFDISIFELKNSDTIEKLLVEQYLSISNNAIEETFREISIQQMPLAKIVVLYSSIIGNINLDLVKSNDDIIGIIYDAICAINSGKYEVNGFIPTISEVISCIKLIYDEKNLGEPIGCIEKKAVIEMNLNSYNSGFKHMRNFSKYYIMDFTNIIEYVNFLENESTCSDIKFRHLHTLLRSTEFELETLDYSNIFEWITTGLDNFEESSTFIKILSSLLANLYLEDEDLFLQLFEEQELDFPSDFYRHLYFKIFNGKETNVFTYDTAMERMNQYNLTLQKISNDKELKGVFSSLVNSDMFLEKSRIEKNKIGLGL